MKKRGFTLIELIAVIVVLAIIALIATPKIVRVIKDARREATERSAERYLDAVETAVANDKLKENNVKDGVYEVNKEGNLVIEGHEPLIVEISGDKPKEGSKVAIQNGQVISLGTNMTIGKYTVTIDDKGIATATLKDGSSTKDTILCKASVPSKQSLYDINEWKVGETIAGVQATREEPYALGSVYSCELGDGVSRTFYVLKEDGNNVKLIMNENIGDTIEWINFGHFIEAGGNKVDYWNSKNTNVYGPLTANAHLANLTSGWARLINAGGVVTLPEAQDIADAMGDTEWSENNQTEKIGPTWLWVNLYDYDITPFAYWTSTPEPDDASASDTDVSYCAWVMFSGGYLKTSAAYVTEYVGIRPVITISKSNMSL